MTLGATGTMGTKFQMSERFGTFPAEGAIAAQFRITEVQSAYDLRGLVVFDFTGVRNINASFTNALLVPLIERHGEAALKKLKFHGCNPVVRLMIEGALSLGLERAASHRNREFA